MAVLLLPAGDRPTPEALDRMSKLLLRLKQTQFISMEKDIGSPPDDHVMEVEAAVFDNALALASAVRLSTGKRWRPPGTDIKCRALSRADVISLVAHLREVLASTPSDTGLRQHQTAEANLRAFFAVPTNRRGVQRLLALFERGGELTVTGE